MCQCKRPNVNGEQGAYSWDGKEFFTREPSPPQLLPNDKLIIDAPGRCNHGIDSHCHHFRLVLEDIGGHSLLVKHGGGEERIPLGYNHTMINAGVMAALNADQQYWLLHSIHKGIRINSEDSRHAEESKWRQAAREKRIKLRRKKGQIDVSILPHVPTN